MVKLTKTSLTLIMLFTVVVNGLAQNSQIKRTNHWFFGGKAGISFSSGTAVADTNGQLVAYAGTSSISDTAGSLLMYTEGQNVWNKNHQIMPNGTGLFGLGTPTQGSVIIPKPLNDNIFYIFTCDGTESLPDKGIRYSVVDMTLNGGLGDVIIKNELLFSPSGEQLGATMHANCTDIWIMGHELGSNNYRAYLLTSNGIDTNNVVINTIGNYSPYRGLGLRFSPNGKKMAAQNNWDNLNNPTDLDTLDLLDFDNITGLLSNLIKLPDTTIAAFNFSPNSKLLYVSNFNTELANQNVIPGFADVFQYDVSSSIASVVKSSKTLVYQLMRDNDFSDYQIGIDNVMYIANPFHDSISIIQNPNVQGIGCAVQELVFSLNGRYGYVGFPNFVSSYFNQDSTSGCFYTDINEINDEHLFMSAYPNPFSVSTTITIEGLTSSITNIKIYLFDIVGKKIHTPIQQNFNEFTLYRENLKSGIYILQLNINNTIYTQKLIIF